MPPMYMSSMTDDDLTANSNTIKEIIVNLLEEEGLLTKSAQEINETYAVIIHRRGFFGKIIDKMLGVEGDKQKITLVKVL